MSFLDKFLGPRVPDDEIKAHRSRYRWPSLCFAGAMLALIASLLFPYWTLDLAAPQFPRGLQVSAYVNRLVGATDELSGTDQLEELDQLNHYVGMPSLKDGAQFERSIAIIAIVVFVGLLFASIYIHSRWVVVLVLPALLFPLVFLADLQYWLWNYGHNLDPRAPFSAAVGEFTPKLFGTSEIAQFDTVAKPGPGLLLAFGASLLVAVGLWLHRRAYKPLVEAEEGDESGDDPAAPPGGLGAEPA